MEREVQRLPVSLWAHILSWVMRPPEKGSVGAAALSCRLLYDAAWAVRRMRSVVVVVGEEDVEDPWKDRFHALLGRLCNVTVIDASLMQWCPLGVRISVLGGALDELGGFQRLVSLSLVDVILRHNNLGALSRLPRLEDLSLRLCGDIDDLIPQDAALFFMMGFSCLKKLCLRKAKGMQTKKESSWVMFLVEWLPTMARVLDCEIFLKVSSNHLGAILLKFPGVNSLSVGGTLTDVDFAPALKVMKNLREIHIQRLINVKGDCFGELSGKLEVSARRNQGGAVLNFTHVSYSKKKKRMFGLKGVLGCKEQRYIICLLSTLQL